MRMLALFLSVISLCSHYTLLSAYDLAVCAIFQDEAPYIKEWIEFHKLQGVQHFYLYNNKSRDNYLEVLTPYIESGDVTLVQWPFTYDYGDHAAWIRIQTNAYMDCIFSVVDTVRWLAVIDTDEFLFCPKGEKLTEFLKEYAEFPGLAVNWIKFGTSEVWDVPSDYLMIELLTRSSLFTDKDNHFVKAIVQPSKVKNCTSPHYFQYKDGAVAVDANKVPIRKKRKTVSRRVLTNKIRINHYWSRTERFLLERKIPGRQKRRSYHATQQLLQHAASCNARINTAILQFVAPLRERMGLGTPVLRQSNATHCLIEDVTSGYSDCPEIDKISH